MTFWTNESKGLAFTLYDERAVDDIWQVEKGRLRMYVTIFLELVPVAAFFLQNNEMWPV